MTAKSKSTQQMSDFFDFFSCSAIFFLFDIQAQPCLSHWILLFFKGWFFRFWLFVLNPWCNSWVFSRGIHSIDHFRLVWCRCAWFTGSNSLSRHTSCMSKHWASRFFSAILRHLDARNHVATWPRQHGISTGFIASGPMYLASKESMEQDWNIHMDIESVAMKTLKRLFFVGIFG